MAGSAESKFNIHPMDQFVIKPLFGDQSLVWYTYTNQAFWMTLCFLAVVFFFVFGTRHKSIVPGSQEQGLQEIRKRRQKLGPLLPDGDREGRHTDNRQQASYPHKTSQRLSKLASQGSSGATRNDRCGELSVVAEDAHPDN